MKKGGIIFLTPPPLLGEGIKNLVVTPSPDIKTLNNVRQVHMFVPGRPVFF